MPILWGKHHTQSNSLKLHKVPKLELPKGVHSCRHVCAQLYVLGQHFQLTFRRRKKKSLYWNESWSKSHRALDGWVLTNNCNNKNYFTYQVKISPSTTSNRTDNFKGGGTEGGEGRGEGGEGRGEGQEHKEILSRHACIPHWRFLLPPFFCNVAGRRKVSDWLWKQILTKLRACLLRRLHPWPSHVLGANIHLFQYWNPTAYQPAYALATPLLGDQDKNRPPKTPTVLLDNLPHAWWGLRTGLQCCPRRGQSAPCRPRNDLGWPSRGRPSWRTCAAHWQGTPADPKMTQSESHIHSLWIHQQGQATFPHLPFEGTVLVPTLRQGPDRTSAWKMSHFSQT